MPAHKVVKHDEWLKARKKHLAKEKEFTRMRDQLSRERRDLPGELVEKPCTFEGEHGRQPLADLFQGRGQLVIYHAMFNPETAGSQTPWTADAPCYVCSFWMDNFNGITVHLNHRDHHGRGLASPLREDCRLQETDGLELSVAVLARKRLQL
jgi:predicted dithiol-disulfide oxidoreductase (DUF899 family)